MLKYPWKKQRISNILVEYLIQQEIFDDIASVLIQGEDDNNDVKIAAIKYQSELQKLKLQWERERNGIWKVEIGRE